MSSDKKGLLFCLGCISIIPGIKNQLVNSMSFHPPTTKGYKYSRNGDSVLLFDCHRKRYVTLSEMKRNLILIDPGRSQIQVKFTSVNCIDMFYYINPAAKLTLIYSHSNATDIGYLFGHLLDFSHKAQVNIISYEYNGYGQSKKKASEESLYENIKNVVNYSIHTLKIPPSNLILYGQSIGSAPTIHFASTYNSIRIAGIIIHSGIKSAVSVICTTTTHSKSLPWYDAFRNLEKIQKVKCPVFVIHGTADTVIPFNHGEMLYQLSPIKYTPWYVNGANHCNIELNWRNELVTKVRQFINHVSPEQKTISSKPCLDRDHLSVSRISTLSSQAFENLYDDIEDDDDDYDDYEYEEQNQGNYNYEGTYNEYIQREFTSNNHAADKSTQCSQDCSNRIPLNTNKSLTSYISTTKSANKYFSNEATKIDQVIVNANPSKSHNLSRSLNYHSRDLNGIPSTPGVVPHSNNKVVYGVSIYEENHKLLKKY